MRFAIFQTQFFLVMSQRLLCYFVDVPCLRYVRAPELVAQLGLGEPGLSSLDCIYDRGAGRATVDCTSGSGASGGRRSGSTWIVKCSWIVACLTKRQKVPEADHLWRPYIPPPPQKSPSKSAPTVGTCQRWCACGDEGDCCLLALSIV